VHCRRDGVALEGDCMGDVAVLQEGGRARSAGCATVSGIVDDRRARDRGGRDASARAKASTNSVIGAPTADGVL
jgi:hypothetical protein